jgi:hypothetical protein
MAEEVEMAVKVFGAWVRLNLCAVTLTVALHGCGGGGGGGAPSSPSSSVLDVPLALNAGSTNTVFTQGLVIPAALLNVGQFAMSEVMQVARNGSLQFDITGAHYTLNDADGNGVPSAGDSVTIDYTQGHAVFLGGFFTGRVVIRLASVDDAQHGSVSGTIDFGAGLTPYDTFQGKWLGTVNFKRSVTVQEESITVDATVADDLRRLYRQPRGVNTIDQLETYRQIHLARSFHRDTARASLSGSVVLASELLGGRLDIAIDPAIGSYFINYPDTGSVRITGAANSRVTLLADPAGANRVTAQLDANGDGVADSSQILPWDGNVANFLGFDASSGIYGVEVRNDADLRLVSKPDFNQNLGVDLSRALRLQFNRPVDAGTVLYARLEDGGSTHIGEYGTTIDSLSPDAIPIVAADVSIQGAMILIQPQVRLQDGHFYQLLLSNINDFQHTQAVTVHSADGLAKFDFNVQATVFNTDDLLWTGIIGAGRRSVVMPQRPATLTAALPLATSLPLRYEWTQLSGPTLALGAPNASTTTVEWADASATGIGRAMLQLTVTDHIGRTTITPVEMQVANVDGVTTKLFFSQSEAGANFDTGETRVYSPQTGTFTTDTTRGYLSVFYTDTVPGANWTLALRAPGGGVPAVGNYANAVWLYDQQRANPGMDFSGSGVGCSALVGTFNVLDLQLDNNGAVQSLAADFDQTCTPSNTPAPLHGSIRINSSLPIRP